MILLEAYDTMTLYLVQHGNQNPSEIDPEKGLSEKGRSDVRHLANFLQKAKISVPEIYHSPKARAVQSAEILAEVLSPSNGIVEKENITPMDPIDPMVDEVSARDEDLMVVGHLPYLSKLASKLLANNEDADVVAFQQGGCVALENEKGKWRVKWMVVPDIL